VCRGPGHRALNSIIYLLSAAGFIAVAVMTVTGPLLPLIAAEFGESVGTAGIVVTAFAIPYGVLQIFYGPLGDRVGKLRVIAGALGISTVFTVACGFSNSLESLTLWRFLTGAAIAATVPLSMAYIADEVAYADRQPIIARYIAGVILGQIAGNCFGGIAAEYFEWRDVFIFYGVLSSMAAVALWTVARRQPPVLNERAHRPSEILQTYAALFRERRPRDLIITATLEGVLIFGVLAYFGAYLRHEHGLSYMTIGVVLSGYGVGGAVYSAAVFHIVRVLGERGMILAGATLLGAGYMLLTVVPYWWLCIPVFLLTGLGFYTFHNTMQTHATELSSDARGTAVSLWVFMLFLGQGVGVTFFGYVIDGPGYDSAFIGAGVGVAVLGLWSARRVRRDRA
jgi:MFS transporter, YNFM family, putative membrane transport protein